MSRTRSIAGLAAALGAADAWRILPPDRDPILDGIYEARPDLKEHRDRREAERVAARQERERIEAERARPHLERAEAKRAKRRARNLRHMERDAP